MAYMSMASMMGGSGQTAPVPTQSFSASNILGTAVPQVGNATPNPNYAAGIGGTSNVHIVIVAVVLIGIGYLAYHLNFEK